MIDYIFHNICRLLSLIKGIVKSFCISDSIKSITNISDNIIIIGNGPSLTTSVNRYLKKLQENDCMVVNQFADTDLYEIIKPRYYVLSDPVYLTPYSDLFPDLRIKVQRLVHNINNKTAWKLMIILASKARNSCFVKDLSENNNIEFAYYNDSGPSDFKINKVRFYLWARNMLSPLGFTVLNTALSIAITLKIKNIYLIGADTSWHENFRIDQDTNELYIEDTHFYGKPSRMKLYLDQNRRFPSKVYQELRSVSVTLESYWILKAYAEYCNINVYNASEYSWIDAFKRVKL